MVNELHLKKNIDILKLNFTILFWVKICSGTCVWLYSNILDFFPPHTFNVTACMWAMWSCCVTSLHVFIKICFSSVQYISCQGSLLVVRCKMKKLIMVENYTFQMALGIVNISVSAPVLFFSVKLTQFTLLLFVLLDFVCTWALHLVFKYLFPAITPVLLIHLTWWFLLFFCPLFTSVSADSHWQLWAVWLWCGQTAVCLHCHCGAFCSLALCYLAPSGPSRLPWHSLRWLTDCCKIEALE